ncbi:hypothetical protein NPIL_266691 [Nephila pilipes]|uniref:Uncharacterized protein n=1 Tax=Nephila pilipes TaxID=299642 RepID=A0A8X6Q0Y3_NEPPI|nr:hypothetical protein NPIL_266691 [Nephila pilipes]
MTTRLPRPLDISQAPQLKNNPFIYAYINDLLCGNDFSPMNLDEMIWYETLDISQAPRLENNPFAYTCINNPFCRNVFSPMDPDGAFV